MPKKSLTQRQINQEVQRGAYVQSAGEPATERTVTVVLALNPLDFQHWCEAHGKNPRDRNYLMATPATARGLRNARLEITTQGVGEQKPDIRILVAQPAEMAEISAPADGQRVHAVGQSPAFEQRQELLFRDERQLGIGTRHP